MDHQDPPQPAWIGPYQIRSLLGDGGGGRVFRAHDPRLRRDVALKVLRDPGGADGRLRRFIEEARAASALTHPNILTVYEVSMDGKSPFIVSELIEGRRLREEIDRGPLPLTRVLDIATQLADGLSAAHGAGMVHRDLKPENVMIARGDRVTILDFGLAVPGGLMEAQPGSPGRSTHHDEQTQTEPGLRAGTVPYMSPEQARGAPLDKASDQFALGLIIFEMLSGQNPFRRATAAETLDAIVNDEVPMAVLEARAPVWLRWIVERLLAKDPPARYSSTSDLHRDLKMLRDRLGEVTARTTATTPRRAVDVGLVSAVAAAAAVLAVAAAWSGMSTVPGEQPVFAPFAAEGEYEGVPAWSPDGRSIAYAAEVDGRLQIFTRQLTAGAPGVQITSAPYDCRHPFWSPDGRRLYFVSLARDREGLWSVGAAGGTPQVLVENATRGALSPDGRTLAFLRDDLPGDIVGAASLWLSAPGGTAPWPSRAVEDAAVRHDALGGIRFIEATMAFSPDSTTIGLSMVPRTLGLPAERRGWQFWMLPLSDGAPTRRLAWWRDPAPRAAGFSWMPDSRHIVIGMSALTSPGSDLWMADLANDRAWPLTSSPDSELDPSVSPDGTRAVFTRGESHYDVIEIPLDGGPARPLLATRRSESDPVWSPAGELIAYVSNRSGQDEIWLTSREGQRWRDRPLISQRDFLDDRTIMLSAPSFSPDGRRIAYQRNAQKPIWPLRIWISQTGGGPPVPMLPSTHEGYQSAPTWSPDGEWIAFAEWKDGTWSLARTRVGGGEPPVIISGNGVANATPHWSPAGDWITWETAHGFMLVSPDGTTQRPLSGDQWLAHAWSRDGTQIFGIRDTDDLRLELVGVDVRTARSRVLADLGTSSPVNNPVKGLSISASGQTLLTSMIRVVEGDLWLVEGLRPGSPRPLSQYFQWR